MVDDDICQNQRVAKSVSPLLCSLKSLYIGFNWTLDFICQLLKIFYFYLINLQLNFCPISNSSLLI